MDVLVLMLLLRIIQTNYGFVQNCPGVRVEVGCEILTISQSMTGVIQRRFVFQKWIELNLISVADPRGRPPYAAAPSAPPTDQHFLNFMQFLGKSGKFGCWRPPPGVGAPSYG